MLDVAKVLNNLAILQFEKKDLSQAFDNYKEALKIYREFAKENSRAFLPYVANTLMNFANLYSVKKEFSQALEKYEEALKIYRDLANDNPRTYLPYIAMTLYNLVMLNSEKKEFSQALERYEEALNIFRSLAKESPRTYGINYARMLILGVGLLGKEKGDLKEAKEILKNYSGVYSAQKLLQIIKQLE